MIIVLRSHTQTQKISNIKKIKWQKRFVNAVKTMWFTLFYKDGFTKNESNNERINKDVGQRAVVRWDVGYGGTNIKHFILVELS